jgi:hypothetical protein
MASTTIATAARLYETGDLAAARKLCDQILQSDPNDFYALHLAAAIALREGRPEDTMHFASRALKIEPGHPEVLSNRGAALRMMCRFQEALADYDRALAAGAGPSTLANRGVALAALGRFRDALACYDVALATNPDDARARYNRGLARLTVGEFRDGWLDYESRWAGGEKPMAPRPFDVPEFSDQDWGKGHRIALWTDQGLGDQLLQSSLAADFAARGEKFVLEIDARLAAAFKRSHPDWEVTDPSRSAAAFAACDRHLPLASAGRLLRNSAASFERQPRALLAPPTERAAKYRTLLHEKPGRPIGISWRSFQPAERKYYERSKSAPLAAFEGLLQASGVRLVDLQYGDTRTEREAFARQGGRLERIEGLDLFNDIDGVLAAIDACDLVVTTSNVTAHLAGAIGKRTLLAYPSANPPFHYWSPNAAGRSPWYPSVEIVTGTGLATWPRVLARARDFL